MWPLRLASIQAPMAPCTLQQRVGGPSALPCVKKLPPQASRLPHMQVPPGATFAPGSGSPARWPTHPGARPVPEAFLLGVVLCILVPCSQAGS